LKRQLASKLSQSCNGAIAQTAEEDQTSLIMARLTGLHPRVAEGNLGPVAVEQRSIPATIHEWYCCRECPYRRLLEDYSCGVGRDA
mgnify:CR=1